MVKVTHSVWRVLPVFVGILSLPLLVISNTYAQEVDYNVNVDPSLKITISSNPVVLNLNPNSKSFGTANVDVTVGTNNIYGYQLFMNTDSNITKLTRDNTADGIDDDIPTLSDTATAASFPENEWGYRINNDVGGSSSVTDPTGTNFYPYVPGTMISSSTTNVNENTANLTFASKIDYSKPAGQYELTLKMKALPIVTTYYMQDIASSPTLAETICTEEPTVVLDKRDEQPYTIRRINGDCWMVENLKFIGTEMDSTTSNISTTYTPSNPYRVNNGAGYGELATGDTSANSYVEAKIHDDNITVTNTPIENPIPSTTIRTVWYNYAAASAGTIINSNNPDPQLYDICPAGWKLPNETEVARIADYVSAFSPVVGGNWYDGHVSTNTNIGAWWLSNGFSSVRKFIAANPSSARLNATTNYRYMGQYIRCVMKDINLGNLNYMQDFGKVTNGEKTKIMNSTDQEISYQLKDSRESEANSYWVSKLKDDKVWMLQNLNLGSNLAVGSTLTLTTQDSNVSANWVFTGKTSDGKFPSEYITDDKTGDDKAAVEKTGNEKVFFCTPATGNNYVGCYYNWYTATAGKGTKTVTGASVNDSICPAGWKLPSAGSAGDDYEILITTYSPSAMLVDNPTTCNNTGDAACNNAAGLYKPGFVLSGAYYSSDPGSIGTAGVYWSRSAYSTGNTQMFVADTSNPHTTYGYKYRGYSVRCLAQY